MDDFRRIVEDAAEAVAAKVADDTVAMLFGMALDRMGDVAEAVARRYGARALAVVRSTAQAIADLFDDAIARQERNLSLEIGGMKLSPAPWVSALARIAGRVGMDVGALALKSKLAGLGVTTEMLGVVEEELNREGFTMGALARPSRLATFASLAGTSKSAA